MICPDNTLGYAPVMACADSITGGLLGLSILIVTFAVVYSRNRTSSQPRDAAAAALFITFLAGVLLRLLGALQDRMLGAALVLMLASVAILSYNRR